MVVALLSAVVLFVVIWAAHVVTDLVNARRDYQFYSEVARLRVARQRANAPAHQLERKDVG